MSELPSLTWTAPAPSSWVNIANVAAVTVSGTCSKTIEGQSVLLRAPGPASALATCTSGVFSTSMDLSAVAQGAFTLTADATDTSSNAADQISLSLQKDTVAPTVSFSSPAASAYVQNSLVLSGACSDTGQTVSLAGTGGLTGTATCTAGNAWNATIDITSVADGAISWTADFTDSAGNPATQATRGFIKDLSVPTVAITAPAAGAYINIANKAAFTVSGTCSESGRTVSIAAGAVTATPSCTGGNTWSTTLDLTSLSDGAVTITADHTNVALTPATQASRSFNKDTVAPTAAITAPAAGSYINAGNKAAFAVSGTCSESGQTVSIAAGAVTATPSCTGGNTWSTTLDLTSLSDGAVSITANHTDAAGNPSTQDSRSFTKNTGVPTVAITSPAAASYINIANKAAFAVSGTCSESGQTVSIAAGAVTATPSCTGGNTWSATLDLTTLSDGAVSVTADHSNVAGTAATQGSRSFNKDTVAPTVAISAPAASVKIVTSNQAAFGLSGTCSEIAQNVVISGDATATVACAADNTWIYSANVSAKADGTITFNIDHSDAAGNPATQSTRSYTKDTSAPTAFTITGVTGGSDVTADAYLLDHTTAVIGWNDSTGEDSYDVVIKKASDNSVMCTLVNLTANSVSHDFSACTLTYGQDYKAVVIAKDNDGNELEATNSPYTFKVNRVPTATAEARFVAKSGAAVTLSVLSNDTDPDSDTLTVGSVDTTGTSGTVTNNTTNITYTPTAGFTGVDTFTYTATDSRGGNATATVTIKVMDQFTWTGNNGSVNWAQSGNWCGTVTAGGACPGGAAPNNTQVAILDGTCSSNCSPTIAANLNVGGIKMNSGYAGTVTQATGVTVTVGSSGWTVASGTFSGGNSNIDVTGAFTFSGGAFTSTSATMTLRNAITVSGTPTFTPNGGLLVFNGNNNAYTLTPGSLAFGNVKFNGSSGSYTISGTMTVNGTLTLANTYASGSGALNTGTIVATGNVVMTDYGYKGTGTLRLAGSANQSLDASGASEGWVPNLEIASTGGTVSLGGIIRVAKGYTYTSGTLSVGTSTLFFSGENATNTITPGTTAYNNVGIYGNNGTYTISGTMTIAGTLTLGNIYAGGSSGQINSGTLLAQGNVTIINYGNRGSTVLKIAGSSNQTIDASAATTGWVPALEFASTGGNVSLVGNIVCSQSMTYTSGTIAAGTSTLSFDGGNNAYTVTPGSADYNNVKFIGYNGTYTISGSMNINGTLTLMNTYSLSGDLNTGTLVARGNVNVTHYGYKGTATVQMAGSTDQTLDASAATTSNMPGLQIASTGGTVFFVGAPTVTRNYTFTSGTLDAGTSTLVLANNNTTSTVTPGTVTYNNVKFGGYAGTYTLSGTMTVAGTLTLSNGYSGNGSLNTGAISALGNVEATNYGYIGSATISMDGTASKTLSMTANGKFPGTNFTVNKTGGAGVALSSAVSFRSGQNLVVTSGPVDMATYAFTIPGTVTLNSNTLTKNGGTLTVGGSAQGTGSLFGGFVNP